MQATKWWRGITAGFATGAMLGLVNGCTPAPLGSVGTALTKPGATAAPPAFRDVAAQAGITYRWNITAKRPLNILQTVGNGCAFLDYDGDGNLDILLVGPQVALYKGDGKGHFSDVSQSTGVASLKGNFLGCAVGDYDNDGFPDIYLTAYRGGALLHNEGGQRLRDVTGAMGIAPQKWGTSAAFADVNQDGKLDLFIGNYVQFGPQTDPQLCTNGPVKSSCGPRFYKAEQSALYVQANGRFADVTRAWGADKVEGKALGVAIVDLHDANAAGKADTPSITIGNDAMPGDLLQNDGRTFTNIGKASGTAYDDNGSVHGGMGVDWGDYDNDGKFDLVVGTYQNETKNIYHNDGDGLFADHSAMLGMAPATPKVTFGIKWLDFDNDGNLDIVLANGHVQDNIAEADKTATYKQSVQLFHSLSGKRFEDASTRIDAAGLRPIGGRGLAVGDYDNDGKVDVLVVDYEGAPLLLHNETTDAGHFLTLVLRGTTSNREGLGARVLVEANGKKYLRKCATDGSFMSASDPRVAVGLGPATQADKVTVLWPSGKKSELTGVKADQFLTVTEP